MHKYFGCRRKWCSLIQIELRLCPALHSHSVEGLLHLKIVFVETTLITFVHPLLEGWMFSGTLAVILADFDGIFSSSGVSRWGRVFHKYVTCSIPMLGLRVWTYTTNQPPQQCQWWPPTIFKHKLKNLFTSHEVNICDRFQIAHRFPGALVWLSKPGATRNIEYNPSPRLCRHAEAS